MLDQQKQSDEKSKVADTIDDECFLSGRRGGVLDKPKPNQQVGRQAHAFPTNEHQQVVVGQDERQHEEHEQIQVREEPVVAGVLPHVADGIDVDEKANASNDQQHDQRKLVEVESE